MGDPDHTSIAAALARYLDELGADGAVARTVAQAAARVPAFAQRLAAAGLRAEETTSVQALSALPIVSKDEVMALQHQDPPFAGLVAPDAPIVRVFQSPGPLYEPQLDGPDAWRWGAALRDLGVGRDDVVLNCFGYHLSPAGAMMEQGALAVGARVLPGGIGNQDLQVRAIADLGVTAYTGLPSYLHALIERYDAAGLDPDRWLVRRAMVTAEPLPDSLRAALERRVDRVQMAYGTAEAGLIGYEAGEGDGLTPAPGVLIQVCDLTTGEPVTDATEGHVVITLFRSDYPVVRFGTGDLSGWAVGPDGLPRLRGVLGRVGAAVKVRGMFLHPAQIGPVLDPIPGISHYRLVVERTDHVDQLHCEVVLESEVEPAATLATVEQRIRDGLRFRAAVRHVASPHELTGEAGAVLVDTRTWD